MYLMFNLQRHHRSAALYNICGFLTSLLLPLSRTQNGAGRLPDSQNNFNVPGLHDGS